MTSRDTAAGLRHKKAGERKEEHVISIHTGVKILGICLLEKAFAVFQFLLRQVQLTR